MYVSFDDGENWQSLQLNLPVVPITDLAVHKRDNDLVAATQGRSFWVIDDLNVVHQIQDAMKADAYLFKPEPAYRMPGGGGFLPPAATIGQNPPAGAVIYYHLKNKPAGDVQLELIDPSGKSDQKVHEPRGGDPPARSSLPAKRAAFLAAAGRAASLRKRASTDSSGT